MPEPRKQNPQLGPPIAHVPLLCEYRTAYTYSSPCGPCVEVQRRTERDLCNRTASLLTLISPPPGSASTLAPSLLRRPRRRRRDLRLCARRPSSRRRPRRSSRRTTPASGRACGVRGRAGVCECVRCYVYTALPSNSSIGQPQVLT